MMAHDLMEGYYDERERGGREVRAPAGPRDPEGYCMGAGMTKVLASFSGGKDSTAMVLRMIELGERLDKVVFCDTGMEFPAMYDHIAKVREYVES